MLDIFVQVQYEPQTIAGMLRMDRKAVASELRQHFSLLKLPHPADANIREPTEHGILVSWIAEESTPLYNQVRSIVDQQDDNVAVKSCKQTCHVVNLSYREVICDAARRRAAEAEKRKQREALAQRRVVLSDWRRTLSSVGKPDAPQGEGGEFGPVLREPREPDDANTPTIRSKYEYDYVSPLGKVESTQSEDTRLTEPAVREIEISRLCIIDIPSTHPNDNVHQTSATMNPAADTPQPPPVN
ncbi:hypothetical protein DXG01_016559 [Tephrocybe rancida]|nr:hypothetical protein DXG01_016559 [Tephrocybe rancida]